MPSRMSILKCLAAFTAAILATPASAHAGFVLITAEEANLPASQDVFPPRAITRGPHVELIKTDDEQ